MDIQGGDVTSKFPLDNEYHQYSLDNGEICNCIEGRFTNCLCTEKQWITENLSNDIVDTDEEASEVDQLFDACWYCYPENEAHITTCGID